MGSAARDLFSVLLIPSAGNTGVFDPVLVGRTHSPLLALLLECCVSFFPGKKHQQRGAVTGVAHNREPWARMGRLHQASGQHEVKDTEEVGRRS